MLLVKTGEDDICGWVLDRDDEIENFLSKFNISHLDRGNIQIPQRKGTDIPENVFNQNQLVEDFIRNLKGNPPKGTAISEIARQICASSSRSMDADEKLVNWVNAEYQIYRLVENSLHQPFINEGNHTLDEILEFSLSVLNSRKSRAGKALEYHLAAIFNEQRIPYSHGEISEGHSRPDFIFPGILEYHDNRFNSGHLVFLGSKTTCKDRWRQILPEAKRINRKHLFTLQQGISSNQLGEMERENVTLVVPKMNLNSFPEPWRPKLLTLGSFVEYVRMTTS
jgi:type II restriction enzyme